MGQREDEAYAVAVGFPKKGTNIQMTITTTATTRDVPLEAFKGYRIVPTANCRIRSSITKEDVDASTDELFIANVKEVLKANASAKYISVIKIGSGADGVLNISEVCTLDGEDE